MDIRSGCGYPASALSNFAPHPFVFRGVPVASMEGFLQGLKFRHTAIQKHIFTLVGRAAKHSGKYKNWRRTQTLWILGNEIDRHSEGYQQLLDEAYKALSKNVKFRKALLASGDAVLKHSIGRNSSRETILTRTEFCTRLTWIREWLKKTGGSK